MSEKSGVTGDGVVGVGGWSGRSVNGWTNGLNDGVFVDAGGGIFRDGVYLGNISQPETMPGYQAPSSSAQAALPIGCIAILMLPVLAGFFFLFNPAAWRDLTAKRESAMGAEIVARHDFTDDVRTLQYVALNPAGDAGVIVQSASASFWRRGEGAQRIDGRVVMGLPKSDPSRFDNQDIEATLVSSHYILGVSRHLSAEQCGAPDGGEASGCAVLDLYRLGEGAPFASHRVSVGLSAGASADGSVIAIENDDTLSVYGPEGLRFSKPFGREGMPHIFVSADGAFVVVNAPSRIAVLDARTGNVLWRTPSQDRSAYIVEARFGCESAFVRINGEVRQMSDGAMAEPGACAELEPAYALERLRDGDAVWLVIDERNMARLQGGVAAQRLGDGRYFTLSDRGEGRWWRLEEDAP